MLVNRPTFKITTTYTVDLCIDGEDLEFAVFADDAVDEITLRSGEAPNAMEVVIRRDDLKSLANCFGVSAVEPKPSE